jgi:hypothetical protein
LIGFSEREGQIEIALVHSVMSGKKVTIAYYSFDDWFYLFEIASL